MNKNEQKRRRITEKKEKKVSRELVAQIIGMVVIVISIAGMFTYDKKQEMRVLKHRTL